MKVGYIADDLTGSNATAVKFKKIGLTSATVLNDKPIPKNLKFDVIGMDLDCRYMQDDMVVKRVNTAIRELKRWGIERIANRIDSTLRGKIGLTTDLLLHSQGPNSVAIVTPSFPDSGRIVVGGFLLVHGQLLENTSVQNDPMNPITQSYVPHIISEQSAFSVTHIGITHVNQGSEHLALLMEDIVQKGNRIIVIDAINNKDIQCIASAMHQVTFPVFPVDPGPLTCEYFQLMYPTFLNKNKYFFSIGSVSDLTKNQLSYLLKKENIGYLYLNPENLLSPSLRNDEIKKAIHQANELQEQNLYIISTCHPQHRNIPLKEISKEQNVSEEKLAKSLTNAIAEVTIRVIEKNSKQVGGVISCGGDVTASLCAYSNASAIKLLDEIASLIAFGEIIGGSLDKIRIVTKGGLIGDEKTLLKCLNFLRSKNERGVDVDD